MNSSRDKSGTAATPASSRVGLQLKCVMILAFLVVGVTVAGSWLYYGASRIALEGNDSRQAIWMGDELSAIAGQNILDRRFEPLQQLVGESLHNSNVRSVVLVDSNGRVIASAGLNGKPWKDSIIDVPVESCGTSRPDAGTLIYSKPIMVGKTAASAGKLVGALRLALDTSANAETLKRVQARMQIIAAAIIFAAIPLGYLLVWRVILQPLRRLLAATRDLAAGDLTSRSRLNRKNELGDLSAAFDAMADEVTKARDELVVANERLEKKVAQRTEDLQKLNLRLREEIAEKEDFIRAVSHDLNAPLRNISGMASVVLMKWRSTLPEEVVNRLERICANASQETSMIADLLELSWIKSRPQKREAADIAEIIESLRQTFEFELKNRNIVMTASDGMPRLYVERNRVRQVFGNLIDNAIKYMNRGHSGRIEVGYAYVDGLHRFHVKDNGPGIPASEHQKIFYVFRRADDPSLSKVEGKGVGLAVVKSIITNYEGTVWVESEVGMGTTFFFTLGDSCTRLPEDFANALASTGPDESATPAIQVKVA